MALGAVTRSSSVSPAALVVGAAPGPPPRADLAGHLERVGREVAGAALDREVRDAAGEADLAGPGAEVDVAERPGHVDPAHR
jgi:hypothetical protein